ncbi:hypothetical protein C5748_24305 [Phyllobacterium phragmitis]|uniref:Uncharacterized protein n=2 Tax=Phyllobacterium phragmitis TaxID=2670329 RepID=A0A2S9IK26_9HYPH|nr:hypothetical protein [Phyllobacterium phragmitis]PRD40877.1 hypothetical protein C5748_24305 [Phyllobacterium phragmitis]
MAVTSTAKMDYLRRPLGEGMPVTYWQLGATAEARYDVPDQPMKGEMDPFFFMTKHKNFIPHEYPCRTAFAAERRGKRPNVVGAFELSRFWLPFGSPRVDLSSFWFRPTVIGTWARTTIAVKQAGSATLRLGTCGGAVLFVNGAEVGWMADYVRNLEARQAFSVALQAGENEIAIFFDDLAERDARYFFQMDYVCGPAAEQALPVPVQADVAGEIEAALDKMHFERPVYRSGEVALMTSAALSVDAAAVITIAGDFMSREDPVKIERGLKAGVTRLIVGETEALSSDFRHFHVAVSLGGFTASRVFGVEICHAERQGQAAGDLAGRVRETLDEISRYGEPDNVTALARLGSGRFGPETDRMIADTLPAIIDCHDCADFALVPLLWCRTAYGANIAPEVVAEIDEAILSYRYWMDEPGNDVQWYFSENHALLFHTAAYLAGALLPKARFKRSGRLGREQSAIGLARVCAWLDHFEKWEMAEFNSAPYFPIDLKGLTALFALAPDADVRERAHKAVRRLVTIIARSAHHGILTGAQGRSYEHTLRAAGSLELSGISRLIWGKGNYGRRVHALPQMALCLRDHGLEIPADLTAIADWQESEAQEWCFAQGQDRVARLYHYKTQAYSIGTAAHYRWNEWGYQETVLHIRLGDNPDAQIWINHPGETIHSGYGRPSYWGGSGSLPRLWHYRGLAVMIFECAPEQPDFTHAWFPRQVFDASVVTGETAVARSGNGLVLLKGSARLERVGEGPTAGNEMRLPGRRGIWIIRLGDAGRDGSEEAFAARFAGLALVPGENDALVINDPDYGPVTFHADGRTAAEGRLVDPGQWGIEGNATKLPPGPIGSGG